MSATQISTSVTIISSLKGYQAVSLNNWATSALSTIAAGSVLEVGGAFFLWGTAETPNASSWTAITTATSAYLQCVPSGSAGSQILTSSWISAAPTWRADSQGWYASAASSTRIIGLAYKVGPTSQEGKELLGPLTATLGKLRHFPLGNTVSRYLGVWSCPSASSWYASALTAAGTVGIPLGVKGIRAKVPLAAVSNGIGMVRLEIAFSDNNTNTPSDATAHPVAELCTYCSATVQTVYSLAEIDIPLDSSGQFYFYTLTATNTVIASCAVYVNPVGFYLGD